MEYCIYKHTSPNGKVYIGQTCQKPENRWKKGKGYRNNEYFTRAIEKYGWDNFQHEVLFEKLSKERADALEIELIDRYKSTNPKFGFNIENGGYGKGKHSAGTIEKMSNNRKGIQAWNKGVPMTEEQKQLLSARAKGKESVFKGNHHSEKSKKLLSDSQNKNKIPVLCVETNIVYPSLKEAERQTGIGHRNISDVCKGVVTYGKRHLTAGGYHWQFFDSKR